MIIVFCVLIRIGTKEGDTKSPRTEKAIHMGRGKFNDEIFSKADAERSVVSQISRRCCAAARKRVADAAAPWRCRPAARKRVAFRQRTGRNL